MSTLPISQRDYLKKQISLTEVGLLFIISIELLLKLRLIFLLNIDVDEFTFLSTVYDYLRGDLGNQFFSFHVHLFSWLPLLSTNEVTQIIAARIFLFGLGLGSLLFTFLIGRFFFNRVGALFSVLSYISISNMIVHGTSFRFDPITVFLFLAAVYFLLKPTNSNLGVIFSGFCIALSFMITLKTLFHLITIGFIFFMLFILSSQKAEVIKKIGLFFVSMGIGFILFYQFHVSTLSVERLPDPTIFIGNLASTDILFHHFFPNWPYTLMILLENPPIWALFFAGIALIFLDFASSTGKKSKNTLILLSFLVSFSPLTFYRFIHPYFYVSILSPAVVLCGVVVDRIAERFTEGGSKLLFIFIPFLTAAVFLNFLVHYKRNSFDQTISQKEIVGIVHEVFPKPVPYIDRCSMISSFPQVGLQMTTWDMERYSRLNTTIMKKILLDKQPVFILANIVYLDLDSSHGKNDIFKNYPLLEEDFYLLKNNFINHWGILYVAGKRLQFVSRAPSATFDILIPGVYTIEARDAITIDGEMYEPGTKVAFSRKKYTMIPVTLPSEVTLRWGADLYTPPYDPSPQPIFFGYYWTADSVKPEGARRD